MVSKEDRKVDTEDSKNKLDVVLSILMLILYTAIPFYIAAKSELGYWGLMIVPSNMRPKLDLQVSIAYIGWLVIQCILYTLPIGGKFAYGLPLRGGHRLRYRLNGLFVLAVNIILFIVMALSGVSVAAIADNITEVVTIAIIIQYAISILLYVRGFPMDNYDIIPTVNSGNMIADWLFGRSLNPRIGWLDIKYVCFRSTIVASVLYNLSILAKSYEAHGGTNVTLLIAIGMQLMYTMDALWFESCLLFLRETVLEGCGCMNLVISVAVPMVYSVVINFIARTTCDLPWYLLVVIVLLYLIGYWIYRTSNEEKNRYRQNQNDQAFKGFDVIPTPSGKNLLVSGWWGVCRHPNYLGDIILNVAMCLPAGFSHILPYMNPLLLLFFLLDRESVDGEECKKKHGKAWDRYCHRVKYRLIPYVY